MPVNQPMRLALVDDHKLFRKGMVSLLEVAADDYCVLFEANNGLEMQEKISAENQPDIILMDINMPGIDGFESVQWLSANFPLIKVLVVSMIEKEESIVKMLQLGVKGYLCKDVEPKELGEALIAVMNKGFYYTDFITGKLVHSLQNNNPGKNVPAADYNMSDREKEFLQYACSEFTYNEIAAKMFLSPKTIDGYRNALFEKLNVKSRVGLVLFAIKNGFYKL
jgi:two-component system, NarL family, invasion response regulator UvrY